MCIRYKIVAYTAMWLVKIIIVRKKIAQFQVMVMIKEKEIELIKCNHIFML